MFSAFAGDSGALGKAGPAGTKGERGSPGTLGTTGTKNCRELLIKGHIMSGWYAIYPVTVTPRLCDMDTDGRGWICRLRHLALSPPEMIVDTLLKFSRADPPVPVSAQI
ncbi:unnamed protein product [Natator depressus]